VNDDDDPIYILPAEFIGEARHDAEGWLDIGGVRIQLTKGDRPGWWNTGTVAVYVRRYSHDLSVAEIHITAHDGLAQEELDHQNDEAERYPLGPKEYWRSQMVGKARYGADQHLMTDDEFEEHWSED
jgi:hypothetical protein